MTARKAVLAVGFEERDRRGRMFWTMKKVELANAAPIKTQRNASEGMIHSSETGIQTAIEYPYKSINSKKPIGHPKYLAIPHNTPGNAVWYEYTVDTAIDSSVIS